MISWNEVLIRLLLAALFGGLIGMERERKELVAGLRTHMMVSVGSCLVMIVSAYGFADVLSQNHVGLDPSRVAAQVVSGIGFIGAGTILFSRRGTIRGLTTAAGLWTVAAIGLATGGGLYFAAAATTLIAFTILWAIQPIELFLTKRLRNNTLKIVTHPNLSSAELLKTVLDGTNLQIQSIKIDREENNNIYFLKFEKLEKPKIESVMELIKEKGVVKEISWVR